jgi:hypothetical protein
MRIFVLVLFFLLIVESSHAEQRLWDIQLGDPCDKIEETEKQLGSLELSVDPEEGVSKYSGTYDGMNAAILYRCVKGLLVEQRIIVTGISLDEAKRFSSDQQIKLAERFGEPVHNGLDLNFWEILFFGFMGADLDYLTRVIVWGRAMHDAMLLIEEVGKNLWQITISQGSSKSEYILNS